MRAHDIQQHWNPQPWMDLKYQVYDGPSGNWVWQYRTLRQARREARRIGGVVYRTR